MSTAFMFLVVMMLLRVVLDLFTNMDEFTEQSESFLGVIADIWEYYTVQSLVYFTELGGLIIVASAGFSLVRMNRTNELTAMLASGVSLHRVVLPIIICSMLMGGLIILDQELMVPRFAHILIRDHDDVGSRARKDFRVPVMTDSNNTGWYSKRYSSADRMMYRPAVTLRTEDSVPIGRAATTKGGKAYYDKLGEVDGWHISYANLAMLDLKSGATWPTAPTTEKIRTRLTPKAISARLSPGSPGQGPSRIDRLADPRCGLLLSAAEYRSRTGQLVKPRFVFSDDSERVMGVIYAPLATWTPSVEIPEFKGYWKLDRGVLFIPSDMDPEALVLRQSAKWISFMSTYELTQLLQFDSIPGERSAVLVLHTRVANPINNLVMLLLGLPFILSRQRNIKQSVALNILVVGAFYVFIYGCRYMEIPPIWAAWLPVMVFGPVAVLMFDSVKT